MGSMKKWLVSDNDEAEPRSVRILLQKKNTPTHTPGCTFTSSNTQGSIIFCPNHLGEPQDKMVCDVGIEPTT
jgi:hypothetical protein